jgi:hypothetical protein
MMNRYGGQGEGLVPPCTRGSVSLAFSLCLAHDEPLLHFAFNVKLRRYMAYRDDPTIMAWELINEPR